jgi:hypothetical protein
MKIFNKIRELFIRVSPWQHFKKMKKEQEEDKKRWGIRIRALEEMKQAILYKDWKNGKISSEEFCEKLGELDREIQHYLKTLT